MHIEAKYTDSECYIRYKDPNQKKWTVVYKEEGGINSRITQTNFNALLTQTLKLIDPPK